MSIKSIKFICAVPRKLSDSCHFGLVHEYAEFKLGLGPCGRTVTKLTEAKCNHFLTIVQHSVDSIEDSVNEVKVFTYKMPDILGRITVTQADPD